MAEYKVTLTHKIPVEVSASTPEAALKAAIEDTKMLKFVPTNWTIKELTEEEEEGQLCFTHPLL